MSDRDLYSARLPWDFFAGRPTSAPLIGARDVLLCVAQPVPASDSANEDFLAHPPIAGPTEMRESIGSPGPVELARGLRIDRLTSQDEQLVINACSPRGHYFSPIRHVGQRYSLVRDVDLDQLTEHPYEWDLERIIWDALVFSRLIRDNGYSTEFAARILDYEDGERTVIYSLHAESKHVYRMREGREWLDAAEGYQLADLLSSYWSITDLPERVRRALWRTEYASWVFYGDLAIPILVSGLEALLSVQDGELTKQFAERGTAVAAELGIGGVDEALCREAYMARSQWVHGSHVRLFSNGLERDEAQQASLIEGPIDEQEREVLRKIALLQDVLRATVRRCIEDAEFCAVFEQKQRIRKRWPLRASAS